MIHLLSLRTDILYNEIGESFEFYGISTLNRKGAVVNSCPAVFKNKADAENFIDFCNKNEDVRGGVVDLIETDIQGCSLRLAVMESIE